MRENKKNKYNLYFVSGIKFWRDCFSKKYSKYFNKKVGLFEPWAMSKVEDHSSITIDIACRNLDEINHADSLFVYMTNCLNEFPVERDPAWECGYAIAKGKPVIALIENKEQINYYVVQEMVNFSITAILTCDKKVAEILKDHHRFVHTKILLTKNPEQFETKIIEYLDDYYRSIYSRSGVINYYVDVVAREMFNRVNLEKNVFSASSINDQVIRELIILKNLKFKSDKDFLLVCRVERNISEYLRKNLDIKKIDSAIFSVLREWGRDKGYILDCLEHSIKPPFIEIKGRKQGIKKTRPELFFELYDLVTHHLISEQRFIKNPNFPYEMGAVIELYNWMNTYSIDDVFDNSKYRQGLKSVWYEFSRKDAIYTGIIGHLLALKYVFIIAKENRPIAKKLTNILNNCNYMIYQGQVLDLVLTFDSESKKGLLKKLKFEEVLQLYCQRIYGICGDFYELIGELASKAGNKEAQLLNAKEVDIISPLIGMYYGLIQMIRNDLGDYLIVEEISKLSKGMKGASHQDVEEGKPTITYLISLYSPYLLSKEKKFLYKYLDKKLSLKEKMKINRLLWKSGSINLSISLIEKIIAHVKNNLLSKYQETPTRMKWMFSLVEISKEILVPFRKQAQKYEWIKYEFQPKILDYITEIIINLEKIPRDKRMSELGKFKELL